MNIKYLFICLLFIFPAALFAQVVEPAPVEPNPSLKEVEIKDMDRDIGAMDVPNTVVAKEKELSPNDFVILEKEPLPINLDEVKAAISYPANAKENGIQGKVITRIFIDKAGNYVKHIVIKNPHSDLTNAVVEHLPKLRFTPGMQSGKPLAVWMTIPFDFRLSKPRTEKKHQD